MKKPSANERADASRLVTGVRSHCLSANHLTREGQVGEGVSPNSLCGVDYRINRIGGQRATALPNREESRMESPVIPIFSKD